MYLDFFIRLYTNHEKPYNIDAGIYRKGVERMAEEVGMTNEQYKGLLLDELEDWQEVLELAQEENNEKVINKAQKQIAKINEKMKF